MLNRKVTTDLFELVVKHPHKEAEFIEMVKCIPKEDIKSDGARPKFVMNFTTIWTNNETEAFGIGHLVCFHGTIEMLRAFLDAGASINLVAEGIVTQRTELFIASSLGKTDFVELLIDRGANDRHESSCRPNFGAQLRLDDVEANGPNGSWCYLHAIHIAIIYDHAAIVKLLLERNVASHNHASLNIGWIDLALLHQRRRILSIILSFLLKPTPNIKLLRIQASRFLSQNLPKRVLAWIERYMQTCSLFKEFTNAIDEDNERLRREEQFQKEHGDMNIFIRTLTGKTIPILISKTNRISEIYEKITDREGIPADQQRLLYAGRQLEGYRTVSDYDIKKDSTLHLMLRMRGGE